MMPLDGRGEDTDTSQHTPIRAETVQLGSRRVRKRNRRGGRGEGSPAGGWLFADGLAALLEGDGGVYAAVLL